MKQAIHLLLNLALFSLIITGGCKPRDPCKYVPKPTHETYNLGEETKSRIPYREDGLDTLVYISDAGDTATLYGQGIDSFYTTESRNGNGDPDCPMWNTWKYETILLHFNGESNLFQNLEISYKARTDFRVSSLSTNVGYSTTVKINDSSFYDTTIVVNGKHFFCKKLSPVPPDKETLALYHYQHGILQLKINNQIWTRKLN